MDKLSILDLSQSEIETLLQSLQQPKFRTKQLLDGLFKHHYQSWGAFSNFPASLRESLENKFLLQPLQEISRLTSADNLTEKILFKLPDGALIETVLMRYERRNSLCVSTQVGCAMGCIFCATGHMGFSRNLSAGEILAQVLYSMAELEKKGESLTHVVYMGMGEPFNNYENTIESLATLTDPNLVGFGARRITISTVGIVPRIEQFAELNSQVNLAVSLHAPNDGLRTELVPANRRFPITALLAACREYNAKTHRRVTFEYALINGKNDSPRLAKDLATLLKGMLCHVNLIALNPGKGYSLQGSSRKTVLEFERILLEHGIPTTIRQRRGIEIQAGCGQLAASQNPE